MELQLTNIQIIEAELTLLTGLHIGGSNTEMHIGGIDNGVIKHPYTQQPYIPGSSLKGRMRSLLEWRAGVVGNTQGSPVSAKILETLSGIKKDRAENIARLFGLSGDADSDQTKAIGPGRLSFWDCSLAPSWLEERKANNDLLTEAKFENSINRISGTATNPRQTERVPEGAVFQFKLSIKQINGDDETLLDDLLAGLKLIEMDGIGGSSSRGYGKVAFNKPTLDGECIEQRLDNTKPFE